MWNVHTQTSTHAKKKKKKKEKTKNQKWVSKNKKLGRKKVLHDEFTKNEEEKICHTKGL